MHIKPYSFFLFLLLLNGVHSQTVSFRITLWGDSVGRMDVIKTFDKDSNTVYTIESKSQVKFLWMEKNGYSKFIAVYRNGKMISSSHTETENGKTKRSTQVKHDGKMYQVNSLEEGNKSFSDPPLCSDASIYFTDCENLKCIFYLPDARLYEMKKTAVNTMEFKSADGHRNVYLFDNGKIKGMEFHLPLATVYMTKIN